MCANPQGVIINAEFAWNYSAIENIFPLCPQYRGSRCQESIQNKFWNPFFQMLSDKQSIPGRQPHLGVLFGECINHFRSIALMKSTFWQPALGNIFMVCLFLQFWTHGGVPFIRIQCWFFKVTLGWSLALYWPLYITTPVPLPRSWTPNSELFMAGSRRRKEDPEPSTKGRHTRERTGARCSRVGVGVGGNKRQHWISLSLCPLQISKFLTRN